MGRPRSAPAGPLATLALCAIAVATPRLARADADVEVPRILSHVRELTETIGSRYKDTAASRRAAEYIRAELRKLDLPVEDHPVGTQEQPGVQLGSMVYLHPRSYHVSDPNVLVRIPGVGPDAESKAILFMAHYDTVRGSPGAVDNAVSVGLLLELARVLAAHAPARTVVLAWTAAEEERLAGARALAQSPLAKTIGLALSLDMVGSRGALTLNGLSSLIGKPWLSWIAGVARRANVDLSAPIPHRVISRKWPQLERSDHKTFTRVGVPAFHIYNRSERRIYLPYHTALDRIDQVDNDAIAEAGRFIVGVSRERGALPSAGGNQGFWLDLPGGPYVISSVLLILFELLLAGVAIAGLVTLWRRRWRELRTSKLGLALVLPAYLGITLAVAGFLRLSASIADHPRPWVHSPLPYVIATLVAAVSLAVVVGWIVGSSRPVAGRARYLALAIAVTLLLGVLLLIAGAPELAWIILFSSAAMGGMAIVRSAAAGWSLLGVATLPLLEVFGPNFLREAVFHGFLPSSVPLGIYMGLFLFPYAMAAVYAFKRWVPHFPRTHRGRVVIVAVPAALLFFSFLVMTMRSPRCDGKSFRYQGLSCELPAANDAPGRSIRTPQR